MLPDMCLFPFPLVWVLVWNWFSLSYLPRQILSSQRDYPENRLSTGLGEKDETEHSSL